MDFNNLNIRELREKATNTDATSREVRCVDDDNKNMGKRGRETESQKLQKTSQAFQSLQDV